MLVFLRNSPFATVESFSAPSIGIGLPYTASDKAEPIGPSTAALRRIDRPGPYYAKCGVMLAELCSVAPGQVIELPPLKISYTWPNSTVAGCPPLRLVK